MSHRSKLYVFPVDKRFLFTDDDNKRTVLDLSCMQLIIGDQVFSPNQFILPPTWELAIGVNQDGFAYIEARKKLRQIGKLG